MILDHVKVVHVDMIQFLRRIWKHLGWDWAGESTLRKDQLQLQALARWKIWLGGNLNSRDVPVSMRCYCWWFRNPANQLRLAVYPIIHRVLYIQSGVGFLPSTVSQDYLYDRRYFYIIRCMYGAFFLRKFSIWLICMGSISPNIPVPWIFTQASKAFSRQQLAVSTRMTLHPRNLT